MCASDVRRALLNQTKGPAFFYFLLTALSAEGNQVFLGSSQASQQFSLGVALVEMCP